MATIVLSAGPKYRYLTRIRLAKAGWVFSKIDPRTDEYRRDDETVQLRHAVNDVLTKSEFSDGTVINTGKLKIEKTLHAMTGSPVEPWHAEDVVLTVEDDIDIEQVQDVSGVLYAELERLYAAAHDLREQIGTLVDITDPRYR